ncbi:MAG: DUF4336 domain-containing protein [Gammaproteobacteria bacterium]|nr:DUF4336 domain-containing protein [Gammaproteobacteria bacterium]
MANELEAYEPINSLKPVDQNVWIVDGPIIRFKNVAFSTRMTIVRLGSGELFVHSPTELPAELKSAVDALGVVRHLISPNKIHYWWIGDWGNAYPDAMKWASPGVRPSALAQGWDFDSDLDETPDSAWREEIDQLIVHGGRFMDEVVFFHKPSRTLILADLIENFEPSKVRSAFMRFLLKLAGNTDPDGKLPIDLRLSYWGRHDEIGQAVTRMLDWEPERIILAHGRWYQSNGVAELQRAFRWVRRIQV